MDGKSRRPRLVKLSVAAIIAALMLAACSPPQHTALPGPTPLSTPTPAPTPEPSPTPLYVPYKRLDIGRLFNGVQLHTSFSTESGTNATTENATPASYTLSLDLHVHIPHASTSQADLSSLNPALPTLLPALPAWLKSAKISPFYERLYRRKIESLQQNLLRLDALLSRHDLFDCETILELAPAPVPPAKDPRKLLLIQSDMDVDSDGSDPDRVPIVDSSSTTFQPITSYKWPKRGTAPNPFIAQRQTRLRLLQATLDTTSDPARRDQLRASVEAARFEIRLLTADSFLVGATDPFIVIPGSIFAQHDDPYSPGIGDFCAVIYNNTLYPAIVGDVGPLNKIGEASLRIAQEINPHATADNRPVSPLKVTYLIFPGTAERPFTPPDLQHIHDRVDTLLKESGGYTGQLLTWKDLTLPPPTPTPSPTSTPSPSPSVSQSSSGSSFPKTSGS